MRADRLVSILMMLQTRPQVTAAQVAEELEVSERTARRDLEALAMSGVPVYSQQGRGGGWRLAGGGRIDLSGLTADEARALFLLAGPRAGASPEVRSALRKLVRALPEQLRASAESAAGSIVIDGSGWDRTSGEPRRPPLLDAIEAATIDGVCVEISYTARGGAKTTRTVHPLGLATKGANWYLVADTDDGMRTFRVDRIEAAGATGEPVKRPEGFDLSQHWAEVVERMDEIRTPVTATGTAVSACVPILRSVFGRRVTLGGPGEEVGGERATEQPVAIAVRGSSLRALAAELAGFGSWVRIDSPPELAGLLGEIGAQLGAMYGER